MTSEQLLDRVAIDSAVCHGQPCIRATRVLVTVALDALAAGVSAAEIVENYPTADCRRRARSRGLMERAREAGDPRAVGDVVRIRLGENITAAAEQLFETHGS